MCIGVHWALYSHFGRRLRVGDAARRRAALMRYFQWLAGWEAFVLLAAVAYVLAERSTHPAGAAWIAPPVGALIGNALPLQLAALAISRSGR